MSVDCAHVEEDWELFALGSLDEADQQRMASHLQSGCKECQRRLVEARAVVASIATTAPARQPSARVELDLMKRVRGGKSSGPIWSGFWPRWSMAPWAVAAVCLVLAGWFFWQQRRLGEELAGANSVIRSLRQAGAPTTPVSPRITEAPVTGPPVSPPSASPENARAADTGPPENRSSDNRRLAELAAENEEIRKENTALRAASAAAEQHAVEMQAALNAAQARTDALTRDLQTAKNSGSENQAEIAALNGQLSKSRDEVARLSQVMARSAQIESLLRSGSVQEIELRAVDPAAGKGFARVLYSPQGGLLLVADSLPKLDHEKCYQLWVIRKGAPAILSAGLLQTSDDGSGFLMAQPTNDLAQLTGLAITDEPKGGSVSARGHKLLFGAR